MLYVGNDLCKDAKLTEQTSYPPYSRGNECSILPFYRHLFVRLEDEERDTLQHRYDHEQ